jgi:homoserine kinase
MTFLSRATAHAPGSIGNLGPGLDVLGAALMGVYDSVTAEWCEGSGVSVLDSGHPDLPTDPARHTSAIAAAAGLRAAGPSVSMAERGIGLTVRKGLPLSAGQGKRGVGCRRGRRGTCRSAPPRKPSS